MGLSILGNGDGDGSATKGERSAGAPRGKRSAGAFMSLIGVARESGVGYKTVRKAVESGRLQGAKFNGPRGAYYISRAAYQKWINSGGA